MEKDGVVRDGLTADRVRAWGRFAPRDLEAVTSRYRRDGGQD